MILLTGATGYVGGRLLRRLEREGYPVRCLCRNPETLLCRTGAGTEVVAGDLLQPSSLPAAFAGVDTAFYLVHSMQSGKYFEERERESASNFAAAAAAAGVRRIIYLGGLAQGEDLSPHMRSRAATGRILREGSVPVLEFRASIILGSGSASFEVIRALVERLPFMITPRWVAQAAQPVAIEDVIEYLVQGIHHRCDGHLTVEIGGSDITSYAGLMREFARQRGLRRWIVRVPFLSLTLSSRWLTLITPVYASIGRFLIESVRHPSVVRDPGPALSFPVRPMGVQKAIARALSNEDCSAAETRWSDAGTSAAFGHEPGHDVLKDERTVLVPLSPEAAFAPVRRIGGRTGWYYGNLLWRLRGLIDLMTGGVGMRRGRPDPEVPLPGTTLDFWRVQIYEPNRRLRLLAEMRVPGRAWLEFEARPAAGGTLLRQTATFEPHGLLGLLYWHLLTPVHAVMFRMMLRRIAQSATNSVAAKHLLPAH